jgi:hypothetical protein
MDEEGSLHVLVGGAVCRHENIHQSCRYCKVYSHAQGKKIGMKTRIVCSPNRRAAAAPPEGRQSNCEQVVKGYPAKVRNQGLTSGRVGGGMFDGVATGLPSVLKPLT